MRILCYTVVLVGFCLIGMACDTKSQDSYELPETTSATRWKRPTADPVFDVSRGNNHDAILFCEEESEYPYYLFISHEREHAYLWRAKEWSCSSEGWELVSENYQIGGFYGYDDGVKVGNTYYVYESGTVFTFTGDLAESSGKWNRAGKWPTSLCEDVGVYYDGSVFHLFGEHGDFPGRPNGTELSHLVSDNGKDGWRLLDRCALTPNRDGGRKYGVGDPSIIRANGLYHLFCDLETRDTPYRIIEWTAQSLDGPWEYRGVAVAPRDGEQHWDNHRVQDPEVAFIAEMDRFVLLCNAKDIDGIPGGDFDSTHLRPGETRVIQVLYADRLGTP